MISPGAAGTVERLHVPSIAADSGQKTNVGAGGIAAITRRSWRLSTAVGGRDKNDGAGAWMRSSGSYPLMPRSRTMPPDAGGGA